jgi:hypothetical protein
MNKKQYNTVVNKSINDQSEITGHLEQQSVRMTMDR